MIHGPPAGHGNLTFRGMTVGSTAELDHVRRIEPALCVYGHIHEAPRQGTVGRSQLANVAAVDLR